MWIETGPISAGLRCSSACCTPSLREQADLDAERGGEIGRVDAASARVNVATAFGAGAASAAKRVVAAAASDAVKASTARVGAATGPRSRSARRGAASATAA